MSKFLSGRERGLKVGIVSYTENNTVLEVVGNTNITGIATAAYFYGDGSNLTNITGVAATVAISTTPPSSPTAGDLWFNSNQGRTFVYYDDGSSSQWVDTAPFNQAYLDAISGIGFSAGISTLPSIYYTDSRSTGIFFPSSDQITVVSSGSSILNINSSGIVVAGIISATSFVGDGSNLTGLSTFSGDYNDLINAPTNLSFFSNDVGFITSYTETSTLNDILGRGNTSAIGISVGVVTSSGGFNLGISSAGTSITSGPITELNFIGAGNTFAVNGTTVDISIAGGGGGGASVSISTEAPSSPTAGDLWYNNDLGRIFIYYDEVDVGIGSTAIWVDAAPFNIPEPTSTPGKSSSTFTATEGQTEFTVSYTAGYIDVFLNGIRLNSAEYLASNGSSVTLVQAATAGDVLDVVEYRMGIGDTGPAGPPASLTIGTRSGGVTQSIAGIAFTVSLRSGIGTVTF